MRFDFQMCRAVTVLMMYHRRTTSFTDSESQKSDGLSGGAPGVRKYCLLFDAFCQDILSEHLQIFMSSLSIVERVFGLALTIATGRVHVSRFHGEVD